MKEENEPKTPDLMQNERGIWNTCPRCGYILKTAIPNIMDATSSKTFFHWPKFCEECGQAIKW